MAKQMRKAFGYLRTSSATNVGDDKDSQSRQRAAIEAWAKRNGYDVGGWYYDAAVSGADPVDGRPGFAAMLADLEPPPGVSGSPAPATVDGQGGAAPTKKYILVESPDRFARDLIVQLTGHDLLKARNIELVAVNAPDFFMEDTPTAVLIRQVLGAIAQFDKANLVGKLASGRRRKKELAGKCEGRKAHREIRPEVVALAKQLRRKKPKGGQMSLRAIADELASRGHVAASGKPFGPSAVLEMINS